MAELPLYNNEGKSAGTVKVSDKVFGVKPKQSVIHQVVTWYLANGRAGTASAKTRAEVSGGGKKPWKQKGTGRARAGSSRSPLWRGGGVVFGPKPRDHGFSLSKKLRKVALCMALTDKVMEKKIRVIEGLKMAAPKTKEMVRLLGSLGLPLDVLLVSDEQNVMKSGRNIEKVEVLKVRDVHVYATVKHAEVLISKEALVDIEKRLK